MKSLAFAAIGAVLCLVAACHKSDHLVMIPKDDAAMNAAVEQARAGLPVFWSYYDAKDPSRTAFAVNANLATGDGGFEGIWIGVSEHRNGTVTGVLSNEPEHILGMHLGSPVQVKDADITDWSYLKGGKLYGYFTTRAMLTRLSAEQRADVDAHLAATPMESPAP